MLKYPALVLDHDDTVVQSEATVNYPFFCYILDVLRPGTKITLQEYIRGCFHPGFADMCRRQYGFTEAELMREYSGWKEYVKTHIPMPYEGMGRIIRRQKQEGGKVFIVSHSSAENIRRDYLTHFCIEPDGIYDCELPEAQRKPSPYPLFHIMDTYSFLPDQLFVVDDLKPACQMAKSAGVKIGFAAWSKTDIPEIIKQMDMLCDYSFKTVEELELHLFY